MADVQQTASSQNQFLGNMINQTGDSITGAINQGTISNLQGTANLSDKICAQTMYLGNAINQSENQTTAAITANTFAGQQNTAQISDKLCCINQNITNQGYENRLQAQALASQLQQQHSELSRQIFEENCKDRELQREIQAQNVRDQLTQAQTTNAALTAQINLTNQLTAQTAYLVAQLGGTAIRTATAS